MTENAKGMCYIYKEEETASLNNSVITKKKLTVQGHTIKGCSDEFVKRWKDESSPPK